MKKVFFIAFVLILITACTSKNNSSEETSSEDLSVETKRIVPKVEMNDSIIQCTGEIKIPMNAIVSIHSLTNGNVKSIKHLEGEAVKKGQVLATIEHIEIIKLQEDYLKRKHEFQLSKQDFERKKLLFQQKTIPLREFEQSEASYGVAKAQFESLKNQLSLLGILASQLEKGEIKSSINLVSPIDGYITKIHVNSGMFVSQDTKMFELIDETHKYVHLSVFANDVSQAKLGQKVTFRISGTDNERTTEISMIGKSIDRANNTVNVQCDLKNEGKDLIVGTTVFATIKLK